MTTIELRFPAHRFHAKPWGRHVNEGVPEWPPSPYRLLRALYDAWKRKCTHLENDAVRELFVALAAEPPRFELPKASVSHTRSYLSGNSEDPTDKSLTFDAFVTLDPGAVCYVTWPSVELTARQRVTLGELLNAVNYLGRSESWIEAAMFNGRPSAAFVCAPAHAEDGGGEMLPVACAVPEAEYSGKRPWLDALAYSTADLLKERRSSPPAMRLAPYVRPSEALESYVTPPLVRRAPHVQAVLLGLDSKVLPLATATIEVAEQIRVRLMGIHKRLRGGDPSRVSPMFSGKTQDGWPRTAHQHLFILPLANGGGRIDRVLLHTRASTFQRDELQAILQLRKLWQSDGRPDVRCVVTWQGSAEDELTRRRATAVASTTPYVTARHWRKGRGTVDEFLFSDVRRECKNHGLPEPASVTFLKQPRGLFEWVEFRRNRKDDPPRPGYGFHLEFAEPVATPFSLGYGCHFGLGQFEPLG